MPRPRGPTKSTMVGRQDARIPRLDFGGDPDTDDLVCGTGPFGSLGERDDQTTV